MTDHNEVVAGLRKRESVIYSALTPNLQGFEAALAGGIEEVAVFASASESFSQRNIQCSIAESMDRFAPVMEAAKIAGMRVRGYVSCVLGRPFEGAVSPAAAAQVASQLYRAGCYEISLGDTIGVGTPRQTAELLRAVTGHVTVAQLAGHFHDTYGQALANVLMSLEAGRPRFCQLGERPGRLPLCAGRHWQCGHRRPRLHASWHDFRVEGLYGSITHAGSVTDVPISTLAARSITRMQGRLVDALAAANEKDDEWK